MSTSSLDIRFYRMLAAKLEQRDTDMLGQLRTGVPEDWAAYKFHQGYLKALADVRELADEIQNEMIEGTRRG